MRGRKGGRHRMMEKDIRRGWWLATLSCWRPAAAAAATATTTTTTSAAQSLFPCRRWGPRGREGTTPSGCVCVCVCVCSCSSVHFCLQECKPQHFTCVITTSKLVYIFCLSLSSIAVLLVPFTSDPSLSLPCPSSQSSHSTRHPSSCCCCFRHTLH